MTDFSEEEEKVIEKFNKLDKDEQEQLVANLGLRAVKTTIEILFPEKVAEK